MTIKREITHGLGALTPEAWSGFVSAAEWVQGNGAGVSRSGAVQKSIGGFEAVYPEITLAKITSAQDLSGSGDGAYMWKYAWTRVVLSGSQSAVSSTVPAHGQVTGTTTNGSTETPSTWAVNLYEIGNVSGVRLGYTHVSDSILGSTGYRVVRVPNDTIVPMIPMRIESGRLQWLFWYPNPIGGSCAVGAFGFTNTIDGGTYGAA